MSSSSAKLAGNEPVAAMSRSASTISRVYAVSGQALATRTAARTRSGRVRATTSVTNPRGARVRQRGRPLVVTVETTAKVVGCTRCGVRAEAQDGMPIDIRDLTCLGRPARLVWIKRRWRCVDADCDAKTWTEHSDHVDAQAVLTRRAGAEACRQVGEEARPVSRVARELGVCWWTVMNAVIEHGTPLVDDPRRIGAVTQLGSTRRRSSGSTVTTPPSTPPAWSTCGQRCSSTWSRATPLLTCGDGRNMPIRPGSPALRLVATDLAESFRAGLSPKLDHAIRVADPFHVVRVGNRGGVPDAV